MGKLSIDYFSDILCIWAFINEKRLEEVESQLGKDLDIRLHFLPNFASVTPKIEGGWSERNGFHGYADHVVEVAEQFNISLHPDTWHKVRPASSMVPHALLKAVQAIHGHIKARQYSLALRHEFFIEAQDISLLTVCEDVAKSLDIDWLKVKIHFEQGQSLSDLNMDFKKASEYQVSVSPAWVFNDGRQKLIGNVGYRVIEANLKELIEAKPLKYNWC